MSRIDRIRRMAGLRRTASPGADHGDEAERTASNLPVPVGPATAIPQGPRKELRQGVSEFRAQLLGQDGQRRGLRAGPGLLDVARSAYNRVEWSGSYDRRARKGRRARADV